LQQLITVLNENKMRKIRVTAGDVGLVATLGATCPYALACSS